MEDKIPFKDWGVTVDINDVKPICAILEIVKRMLEDDDVPSCHKARIIARIMSVFTR